MKTPPSDYRSAHAAGAALEARRVARLQDAVRVEELANARRLQEVQSRQEQEELARESASGATQRRPSVARRTEHGRCPR